MFGRRANVPSISHDFPEAAQRICNLIENPDSGLPRDHGMVAA